MKRYTTEDIRNEFIRKYNNQEFRILYEGTEWECKTIEIQGASFLADKDYIIRKPNYEYANREIQWYESQSLNVNDIPGDTPAIWKNCATKDGFINSNYGWCIFSTQNFEQYKHCIDSLIKDNHTRQACMIYNRPSMQIEHNSDGMHDFMCTYSTQVFLNDNKLDYIVFMRSNDGVFGYDNDYLWHKYVQEKMAEDLSHKMNKEIIPGDIIWNAGSLHIYERHFKFLENN